MHMIHCTLLLIPFSNLLIPYYIPTLPRTTVSLFLLTHNKRKHCVVLIMFWGCTKIPCTRYTLPAPLSFWVCFKFKPILSIFINLHTMLLLAFLTLVYGQNHRV